MKSIGLSEDSSFVPTLINYYPLPDINFNEDCLKNNNNDPSLGAVNLYICYTLDRWSRDLNADFTLALKSELSHPANSYVHNYKPSRSTLRKHGILKIQTAIGVL